MKKYALISVRMSHFTALCAFLFLLVLGSAWEMRAARRTGEARLDLDVRLLAKRMSLHLPGIVWDMDASGARNAVFTEMDDPRLSGVLIRDRESLLEGMRRNQLWEPVPWDDLIPENSVEATAPILLEERQIGEVTVYISRRMLEEELAAAARRELLRTAVSALIPCLGLALLLHRPLPHQSEEIKATPADLQQESMPLNEAACRSFLRAHNASAALLYRSSAKEDAPTLCALADAVRKDAALLSAHPLYGKNAEACIHAASIVRAAALENAAKTARPVEQCAASLDRLLQNIASSQGKDNGNGERV